MSRRVYADARRRRSMEHSRLRRHRRPWQRRIQKGREKKGEGAPTLAPKWPRCRRTGHDAAREGGSVNNAAAMPGKRQQHHQPPSPVFPPSSFLRGRWEGWGTTRREGAPTPVRRGKQRHSWPASPPPSTLLPTGAGGGNDGAEKEQGGRWQYPPHTKLHAVSMQGGSCQIYKQLHAQQSIAKKRTSKLKQTKKNRAHAATTGKLEKKVPQSRSSHLGQNQRGAEP